MKPPDWLTPERAMAAMMILFAIQVLTKFIGNMREKRRQREELLRSQSTLESAMLRALADVDSQRGDKKWTAADMPTADQVMAETMARALNTGKIVFANRREDGSVEYSEDDTPERTETP